VSVCALVVPRFPAPVKKVLLSGVPAEIEAVGTPLATLLKANFAEAVAVDPSKRSSVIKAGASAPSVLCQTPTIPLVAQVTPAKQTTPLASGKVYVRSKVRSSVVIVPVNRARPSVFAAKVSRSVVAVGELSVSCPDPLRLKTVAPDTEAVRRSWVP